MGERCWSEVPLYLSSNAEENREETWRYLSYALLHLDFMHLLSNMLIFLPTGIILELVHGPVRIGAIFLMGIIFGALGHLAIKKVGVLSEHLQVVTQFWERMSQTLSKMV